MRIRPFFTATALILSTLFSSAQESKFTKKDFKEDFNFFWTSINDEYAYFDKKQTDWNKVKTIFDAALDTVSSRNGFVGILEKAFYEIYDHHAVLNTNTDNSERLVPSGTDIWAEYMDGRPIITELRKGFGAAACGISAGMEVVAVNDVPVEKAIEPFMPKSLKQEDMEAKSAALRLLLAGNHVQARKLTLKNNQSVKDFYPDQDGFKLEHIKYPSLLESKMMGKTGYIKINDCLYNNDLITAFDSVMNEMKNSSSIILDLRESPSGGNTTVARSIIGWFTNKDHYYQKHEYVAEEKTFGAKRSWIEIVSPRKGKYYSKPLVVLCNHWTGSIGEAIVIGFDALGRASTRIIGTPMAKLCGAVYSYEMPHTKIHFAFPAEKVFHVNGYPREQYVPQILVDMLSNPSGPDPDPILARAVEYLNDPR